MLVFCIFSNFEYWLIRYFSLIKIHQISKKLANFKVRSHFNFWRKIQDFHFFLKNWKFYFFPNLQVIWIFFVCWNENCVRKYGSLRCFWNFQHFVCFHHFGNTKTNFKKYHFYIELIILFQLFMINFGLRVTLTLRWNFQIIFCTIWRKIYFLTLTIWS